MSKEQQPKRKPGSNSANWELYSGSGKEIDYSSIYCPSLGYGPSLEYGSSLEEMARSQQATGTRRPVNWSRVTVEPSPEQKTEAKPTVEMPASSNETVQQRDALSNSQEELVSQAWAPQTAENAELEKLFQAWLSFQNSIASRSPELARFWERLQKENPSAAANIEQSAQKIYLVLYKYVTQSRGLSICDKDLRNCIAEQTIIYYLMAQQFPQAQRIINGETAQRREQDRQSLSNLNQATNFRREQLDNFYEGKDDPNNSFEGIKDPKKRQQVEDKATEIYKRVLIYDNPRVNRLELIQACRDAALLLFYGEAQEIVGGSTAQRGELNQLFNRLPQQSPPNQPNTASQQLINNRARGIFQAITGFDQPRNRAEQRLFETLRNAILIQWNVNNARDLTSQVNGTSTQSNAENGSPGSRATPGNLNEEIDLYQTALLQEIPQISDRFQAALDSKVFNQDTIAAWNRLSELMIRLYPAAKASNVPPSLTGAIADAGNQLFAQLYKATDISTRTDGSPGMGRFLPPALTGAGEKIAQLVAQNNWNGLYQQYFEFAVALDRWLQQGSNYRAGNNTQLEADRAATDRLEYIKGMEQQLQQFKQESAATNPVRLMADFYPQEKAKDGSANGIEKIPLSLYLWQKDSQFLWQNNTQWMLTQITPKDSIDVSFPKKAEETNPPQALFDQLNSRNRFPKGIIRYVLPNGTAGMVEVDGNWKLSDWLAFIGLGAGLAALTVFTLGSGTALVSTIGYSLFYVGAAAQVGSSVANIYERSQDGTINPMQVSLDAVNIASAMTGVGAAAAGRFAVNASRLAQAGTPYTGMMAKLATFADGWFVPLTGANLAADGVTVALMTADAYTQSQEILRGQGEEGDKRKAVAILIAQLAVTGALITLSVKGNIADLQSGRTLVLDIVDGVPVARSRAGTEETRQGSETSNTQERTNTVDREAQQHNQNQQTPLNSVDAQTGRQSQTGGVRGRDVYELGNTYTSGGVTRGSLNAERLKKVQNKITSPTTGYLHGAVVTHVSNGTQYTVNIPDPSSSTASAIAVPVEVIPTLTSNLSSPHAHHTSAGDESGPARLDLKHDASGGWSARIEVDSALFQEDAAIVISHEINELVDIIHQHPSGPISSSVNAQMEASVFRQGSTATTLTSHDRAAAIELRALYEDLSNLQKSGGSPDKQIRRQRSIDKQLEWMGLNEPVALDPKLKALRQAGVPEEGIRHVEMVGARAERQVHLAREAAGGHTGNSIMREELIRHLMYPEEQGSFKGNGIYGGHHTQRLLDFANDSDKYVMLQRASKSVGGTTFRRFEQYRWNGTGSKPKPGDANFPGGASFNPSDWTISSMPKTTADDIQVYLSEGADAWRNWLALYGAGSTTPYAVTGKEFGGANGVPPAISTNGVEFSGFFKYDSSSNTWTVNTIFIEASWLP